MLNIHQNFFHPVYLRLANVFTSSSLDIFTLNSLTRCKYHLPINGHNFYIENHVRTRLLNITNKIPARENLTGLIIKMQVNIKIKKHLNSRVIMPFKLENGFKLLLLVQLFRNHFKYCP